MHFKGLAPVELCMDHVTVTIKSSIVTHTIITSQFCYGALCPPFQYHPEKDMLNAAQTGALLPNLVSHEFNYLLKQLRNVKNGHMLCMTYIFIYNPES